MLHVTFSVVFVRTPLKLLVIKDFSDAREETTPTHPPSKTGCAAKDFQKSAHAQCAPVQLAAAPSRPRYGWQPNAKLFI